MKRLLLTLTLTLTCTVLAGGGGPRPLTPAFVPFPRSSGDCREQPEPNAQGCRLRVPLPATSDLNPGEYRVIPGADELSIVYRAPAGTTSAQVCCGLQLPLSPVPGTDLWGVSARVKDVQKAALQLGVMTNNGQAMSLKPWRGPQAPPALTASSSLQGELKRFTLQAQSDLVGTRWVSVYTPPGWKDTETLPAVYLADDAAEMMARTLEPLILLGKAPRVVLVGIENGGYDGKMEPGKYDPSRDIRAKEYLQGYEGGTVNFEAHEKFILNEVIPEMGRRYHLRATPQGRIVSGFSNGASWAISMGARHRDVFGGVIALSPGWNRGFSHPGPQARVFTSGGTLEPHFLKSAKEYAALSRQAGNPTWLVERVGGHDSLIWQEVFPAAVNFVLGGR